MLPLGVRPLVARLDCRLRAACLAWELLKVASQERIEDPPFAATVVLDDPCVAERSQGFVGHVGRESLVELGAERDALGEPLRVPPERADMSERLLVLEPVRGERSLRPSADMRDVYPSGWFERRDVVSLLGDQHRRARVPLAMDDELLERVIIDCAPVELQPCRDPDLPVVCGDRRQLVEAAELAQGPLGRAEQVAHHVLDRSGEQDR